MDTIPLILQLIKSNFLLYSVAVSGNIDSIPSMYDKEYFAPSDYAIKIDDFMLSPSDVFDYAMFIKSPVDSLVKVVLFTQSTKYEDNRIAYFGNQTVYHKVQHIFDEHGFTPNNPYRYCYPDSNPPAYVAFHHLPGGNYSISLEFGKSVCEGRVFSLPEKKED